MVAKLASFAQREGTWDNQWDKQKEKIADLQGALATEHDPRKRFTAEREIAAQALYAGDVETAISTLENLQRELGGFMPADAAEAIQADLAFAHLRRGETENCAEHHTAESCIFPIGGEGVHQIRRGSERAVELYRQLLSSPSTSAENALSYRWLMNIGAMTLGQYPEGVPRAVAHSSPGPRVRVRHRPLQRRGPEPRPGRVRRGRRPDPRGLRQRRSAGHPDLPHGGQRPAGVLPQRRRGPLQPPHRGGGTEGARGRAGHLPGRLRQRRLHRRVHPPRRVAARLGPAPAVAAPQQLQRDLHRRDLRGRVSGPSSPRRPPPGRTSNHDGFLDLFVGYEISRQVAWPAGTLNFQLYLNNGDGTFTDVGARPRASSSRAW